MNLTDMLVILEYAGSEGFHNVIVNILYMVLKYSLMLLPHALPQIKPNLFIRVDTPFCS